jgi:hypothetical protein
VRSDLPPPEPTQILLTPILNGNYKCGSCTQCNSTIKTSFRHPHTGGKIPVRGIISCKTKGVICLINCSCGKAYVEQTKRQLKQRRAEHCCSIRCKNIDYPVAAHFVEANHSISSLKCTGNEHVLYQVEEVTLRSYYYKRRLTGYPI